MLRNMIAEKLLKLVKKQDKNTIKIEILRTNPPNMLWFPHQYFFSPYQLSME